LLRDYKGKNDAFLTSLVNCQSWEQNCGQIFITLAFDLQCTVINVACESADMYLSVYTDISGMRKHTSKIHQILFACYV